MSALVIYFSQTGHTELLAKHICDKTGIDRRPIRPKIQYPPYGDALKARALKEADGRLLPVLLDREQDLTDYGYIFLGFPIWYGMPAPPVMTFVHNTDWRGRTVFPFITYGGLYGQALYEVISVLEKGGASVKEELMLRFPYNRPPDRTLILHALEETDKWISDITRRYGTNIRK